MGPPGDYGKCFSTNSLPCGVPKRTGTTVFERGYSPLPERVHEGMLEKRDKYQEVKSRGIRYGTRGGLTTKRPYVFATQCMVDGGWYRRLAEHVESTNSRSYRDEG